MEILNAIARGFMFGVLAALLVQSCHQANAAQVNSKPYYKALIAHTATEHGLDPAVALAVAEVESSFNVNALGSQGEVGLFQLHPRYFPNAPKEAAQNIEVGVKHLLYWKERCPYKANKKYVICFNRGRRPVVNPKTTPYYRKVISAYQKYSIPSVASSR